MILLSFIFTFIGFVILSLAMKRHFKQLMPTQGAISKQQTLIFRLTGSSCLFGAALLAMFNQGVGLGLTYWAGLLMFAALLQVLLLNYHPKWLMHLLQIR